MDDEDRDSNASSDNDQDDVMEDAEEPEAEAEAEAEAEVDNDAEEEENDDDDDDEQGDEAEETFEESQDQPTQTAGDSDLTTKVEPGLTSPDTVRKSATPAAASAAGTSHWRFKLRPSPEALNARLYDIVPTMAAPQATSINAMAITPDLRYWLTGGSDCYIRKYDGPSTINGKQLLTVAQRHPFVDSVTKAGVIMSYWANEEPVPPNSRGTDEPNYSPVYSLAVHCEALWLLSGLESGGINLQSVRHDEGKRITCLQKHTNAVSVLALAPDEKSVVSGSWDKNIYDWDLNTGNIKRSFDGTGGQISAVELRPASGAPMPLDGSLDEPFRSDTFTTSGGRTNLLKGEGAAGAAALANGTGPGGWRANDAVGDAPEAAQQASPAHGSLFGDSDAGSLFGDTVGGAFGNEDDDEFSRAMEMTMHGDQGHEGGMDHSADMAMALGQDHGAPPPAGQLVDVKLEGVGAENGDGEQDITMTNGFADPSALHDGADPSAQLETDMAVSQQQQQQQAQQRQQQETSVSTTMTLPGEDVAIAQQEQQPPAAAQPGSPSMIFDSPHAPRQHDSSQVSDQVFLSAAIDGTLRIWDRRVPDPVARIATRHPVPPWCMAACWSPDGDWIYAGRRNGTVEEYSIHKARGGWAPERALRFPAGSGPVSALRPMANGRHLICASHDILRLYDLRDTAAVRHSRVPFLIVPGPPRAGVISALYIDQTSRFMISAAGTRGWEGTSTEVLIGYEIGVVKQE